MCDFKFPISDNFVASFDGDSWERLYNCHAITSTWETLDFLIDGYKERFLVVAGNDCVCRITAYHNPRDDMHQYVVELPWRFISSDYETHDVLDDVFRKHVHGVSFYEVAYRIEREENGTWFDDDKADVPVFNTDDVVSMTVKNVPLYQLNSYLDNADGFKLEHK